MCRWFGNLARLLHLTNQASTINQTPDWPSSTGDGDVKFSSCFLRLAYVLGLAILLEASGIAASVDPSAVTPHKKTRGVTETHHAKKRMRSLARSRAPRSQNAAIHSSVPRASVARSSAARSSATARHRYYERFYTSSFASDITEGDVILGED